MWIAKRRTWRKICLLTLIDLANECSPHFQTQDDVKKDDSSDEETGMNLEVDYGVSSSRGNGKLRHWLIEQVDCGKYPGLVWENNEKSIFRIPWKHAGKQDYSRDEDAALFKAWALFKGKFREGVDKPDPPTWKTRLRCALNKSNDFEELVDRSQLDISEPYKVYRIIPESAKKRARQEDNPVSPMSYKVHSYPSLQNQMPQYMAMPECVWRDYCQDQAPLLELPYSQCPCSPRNFPWKGPSLENGYQLRAPIYSCGPAECQPLPFTWDTSIRSAEAPSDVRLHVSVYFRDSLMQEVTTSSLKGCHITPFFPEEEHNLPPGGPDVIPLPLDCLTTKRRADDGPQNPFSNLERGVLLWMGVDGLYAHRLCQSRVYWHRGLSTHGNKPNMLEREVTSKLLDTQDYLTGIQSYGLHDRPLPYSQVLLSFGEEFLDPQSQRCTLTVQVEPLIARQLLYYAQQTVGHYYHSYDLSGVTEYTNTLDD